MRQMRRTFRVRPPLSLAYLPHRNVLLGKCLSFPSSIHRSRSTSTPLTPSSSYPIPITSESIEDLDNGGKDLYHCLENLDVSTPGRVRLPAPFSFFTETRTDMPLYVRPCYNDLWRLVLRAIETKPGRGVVFSGNPGIGKSWLLNYFLIKLLQDKKTVVFQQAKYNQSWIFDWDNKSVTYVAETNVHNEKLSALLSNKKTVRLFDPMEGAPTFTPAFTIMSSSPNPRNYKEFLKLVRKQYIVPVWSEKELLEIAGENEEMRNQIKRAFPIVGGIPRYVFDQDNTPEEILEPAFAAINAKPEQALALLTERNLEPGTELSHKLVQYRMKDDKLPREERYKPKNFTTTFASEYVIEKLVAIWRAAPITLSKMLSHYADAPWLARDANMLEELALKKLSAGGQFIVNQTASHTQAKIDLVSPEVVGTSRSLVSELSGLYKEKACRLWRPKERNFGAVDGLAIVASQAGEKPIVYGFQMTIAKAHPIKVEPLRKLLSRISTALFGEEGKQDQFIFRLTYVVPTTTYHRQSFVTASARDLFIDSLRLSDNISQIDRINRGRELWSQLSDTEKAKWRAQANTLADEIAASFPNVEQWYCNVFMEK
jgi:hypothetical protein